MMIAVAMIFICSVVFVAELSISKWFNHADLAHVFMAIGGVFFYLASKEMMLETQNGKDLKRTGNNAKSKVNPREEILTHS